MKYVMQQLMLIALVSSVPGIARSAQAQPLIEKVKIGVAAPLTGPQAHYGKDFLNGIKLAADDFNANKPLINGKQIQIVLDVADDQADAHLATTVAQKLVDDGIKGMLGHFNSDTTIAASRIYAQAGIPQIAMATSAEYTQQGFKNTFRMMASDKQQGKIVGPFVVRRLHLKRIAIINDQTMYGQGLADHFEQAAKKAGAIIVGREYIQDKTSNFTKTLNKFKSLKADAIFYSGADTQAAAMVKQRYQLGIKAQVIASDMVKTSHFVEAAGKDCEGVMNNADGTIVALSGESLDDTPQGQKFLAQYKKSFHEASLTYAPYAYDGAMAMFTSMQKANSTDPVKYLSALANIKRAGITTNRFAYDKYGNLKDAKITLHHVVQGEWQVFFSVPSQ